MRVALIGLYSSKYPAIGETHALSVLAAVASETLGPTLGYLGVYDMVAKSEDRVEPLLAFLSDAKPDILGISVPYGTYSFLCGAYERIREAAGSDCLIVLGGPVPTALPEQTLIALNGAFVVVGEGETAFRALLRIRGSDKPLEISAVPGLAYLDDRSAVCRNERVLTDLDHVPPPHRDHVQAIATEGGQIYTEASRGCSWAACKFCLRGLTDLTGTCTEHRAFPASRLHQDFLNLRSLGVGHITFADEDFLGRDIEHASRLADAICTANSEASLSFDASIMPCSIHSSRMSNDEVAERQRVVSRLKASGLRKAFLGIESGSSSQLRRYAKGHTPEDAAVAAAVLHDLGVDVEVGWIMFDPLCSRAELAENVEFLRATGLFRNTSYVFSEMRLQIGGRYISELVRVERSLGIELFSRSIDPDTLSHGYRYLNLDVDRIVSAVRNWSDLIRPLHYPLKSLSRFEGSILEEHTQEARGILGRLRSGLFEAFEILVAPHDRLDHSLAGARDAMECAGNRAALEVSDLIASVTPSRQQQPALAAMARGVLAWRGAPHEGTASRH
jgi:radical SAM superfamily enzyme YgiQ (UPF0313 family)